MESSQNSYGYQIQTLGQNTNKRTFQPSLYLDDYRNESWNGYAAMSASTTETRVMFNRWQSFPMQIPPFDSSQNVSLPATSSQNSRQTLRMPTPPSYNNRRPDFGSPQNARPYMRMPQPLTNTRVSERPPFSNIQHNNTGQPNLWRQNVTCNSAGESSFGYGHASYQPMNFNHMNLYRGIHTNTGHRYHFNSDVDPQFGNKQQCPTIGPHIENHNSASVNTPSEDQCRGITDDRSILGKWYKLPDSDIQETTGIEKYHGTLEEVMKHIENTVSKEKSVSSMPGLLTKSPVHDVSVSLELQEVTREGDQNRQDSDSVIMETENQDSSVTKEIAGTYVVEKVKNKRKRGGNKMDNTSVLNRDNAGKSVLSGDKTNNTLLTRDKTGLCGDNTGDAVLSVDNSEDTLLSGDTCKTGDTLLSGDISGHSELLGDNAVDRVLSRVNTGNSVGERVLFKDSAGVRVDDNTCVDLDSVERGKDTFEIDNDKERTVSSNNIAGGSKTASSETTVEKSQIDNVQLNNKGATDVKGDQTESINKKDKTFKSPRNNDSSDQSMSRIDFVEDQEENQNSSRRNKGARALVVKLFDVTKCKNMKKKFKIDNSSADTDMVIDTDDVRGSKRDVIQLDSDDEDISFPAFSCSSVSEVHTNSVSVTELQRKETTNNTNGKINQGKHHDGNPVESSVCNDPMVDYNNDCNKSVGDSNTNINEECNSRDDKSTSKHDESYLSPNLQYRKGFFRKRHRSNVKISKDNKKRKKRQNVSQNRLEKGQEKGSKNKHFSNLADHYTVSKTKDSTDDSCSNYSNTSHISDLPDHHTVSKRKEPIDDSCSNHSNTSHISDLSECHTISKTKELSNDSSGSNPGNSQRSPGKNVEESTDLVDILSHTEQYFNIDFHGSSVLCVSINTGKFLVMKELLTKCFKSIMNPKKGNLSSKFRQVYLAKERDLKIPYKELPDSNKLVVGKYLVSLEILSKENQHHIGIISLSDSLRLYHYFFGVKSCINCVKFTKSPSQNGTLPETVSWSDTCEDDNGADSDSTIQYVDTDDDDDDDDDDMDDGTAEKELTNEIEDRVLKGGIAELYRKMFRFLVINSCKYFPFKDLELFCNARKIEQIIKSSELKTRYCSEIEGSFFCKLEPSLPSIMAKDRLVEEKVLHEAAKYFVNLSNDLNESRSQECLSKPDVEKVDKGSDEANSKQTPGNFIDLTLCNTKQDAVSETNMDVLQMLGQRSCDRFDRVIEDIGQSRNIDICPKEDGKMKYNDAEDIVSILNGALSQDDDLKSLDCLDKENQLEEVKPEDLKSMFCVCQKSFNENQKIITRAFLTVWKQNISLKKQVEDLKSEIEDVNIRYDMLETKRKKYEDMIEQLTNV